MSQTPVEEHLAKLRDLFYGELIKNHPGVVAQVDQAMMTIRDSLQLVYDAGMREGDIKGYERGFHEGYKKGEDDTYQTAYDCGYIDGSQNVQ